MNDLPQSTIDQFPEAYARTQRFASGAPRNFSILPPITAEAGTGSLSAGPLSAGSQDNVNGARVLFLRAATSEDATLCLWALDISCGDETLLVNPRRLETTDVTWAEKARRERTREAGSGIVSYSLDHSKTKACFTVGGDLVVVDLNTGAIDTPTVEGTVFDPRLSPNGASIAYVAGDTVRVLDLDRSGSDRVLIADSIPGISYGRADFVAAEEMGRRRGFWWSPSSQHLLVTKVDERPVNEWWIGDAAHPDQRPSSIRYPQAGSRNAQTDLLMIDAETGASQLIDWDADDHYEYLANIVWPAESVDPEDPDANINPIIVRQTRDQQEVSIAALDIQSHSMRTLETILDDVWVELIPTCPTLCKFGVLTIEDLWTEAPPHTDGQRSLVLNGTAITGEGINVHSIVGLVGDYAIFSASTVPTEVHIFATNLKATAETAPQPLTTEPGVHSAVVGKAVVGKAVVGKAVVGKAVSSEMTVLITSAVPERPGSTSNVFQVSVTDRPGNHLEKYSELSITGPLATVTDLRETPPITAHPLFLNLGTDLLPSALFLPSSYDGSASLPVLLDPYGGPHAQRVLKYHNGHLVSQWFAEQGYAVLVTDGSGTPGRGPTWERRVWGDLSAVVLEDQLNALDAAAAEFEGLDLNRVGIRGWSFGGYLAALGVLRAPDRIHAAISGAPVTSWRLYDTHYTERYLGHPDQYPHHYEQNDLIADAEKLTRPLLLIHGLADDNVVAAHTLRLSSALLGAGRSHQVLPLSGVTHMTPQQSVAENLLWLQLEFLNKNVRDRSLA